MTNLCVDASKWERNKNSNGLIFANEEPLLTITKDKIIFNEKLKEQLAADEYAKEVFKCLENIIKENL